MKTIIVATKNKGKIDEYRVLFAPYGYRIESLLDYPAIPDVEETGTTFAENALLKAKAVSARLGGIAVADDSGLEVSALGGAPGVLSQRYSDEGTAAANNAKLLKALAGVDRREARFVCTIVVLRPDGTHRFYQGALNGLIARTPRGTEGFGFDPLFFLPERGCTVAELDMTEKNRLSHRGRAFLAMIADRDWWSR
ncbi:MAG: RdgB/HAM1 family non-canonical purine NTP pyrophosphatase [Bacillota bacterium]|nr:RdgB/HAM1 family non-canonical purine NTP pyrophosphatase [Bacillota bacterium]